MHWLWSWGSKDSGLGLEMTLFQALQSVIYKFWCSINKSVIRFCGTGDGCSLENVSSDRSPEAGSRAPKKESDNVEFLSYIVRG